MGTEHESVCERVKESERWISKTETEREREILQQWNKAKHNNTRSGKVLTNSCEILMPREVMPERESVRERESQRERERE